jgi:two-component system NtrC family sensor kinase
MRGRSKASRKKADRKKAGRAKAKAPRSEKAVAARPRRRLQSQRKLSAKKRQPIVAHFIRELAEITEQQRATEEVLRVISSSSGDLQQIFATILANAVQVSRADNGVINRWDGEALHLVATHNLPPAFTEIRQRSPYRPDQHSASGRMLASRGYVHIADLTADRSYAERNPPTVAAVELGGVRTTLAIPMMKGGQFIGSFTVGRTKVQPFTERQIEVVTSFANQAVIAVENARLFHELREALQQQTATSKVLQVISSSPGDLQPAFDTVLENAMQICDAEFGNIYTWDGEALYLVAWHNTPPAFAAYRTKGPFRPSATSLIGKMVRTKSVMHVPDAADNVDYTERRDPSLVAAIELGGVRTYLGMPMMRENEVIGAITIFRQDVRPFTEKQIAMLTGLAEQAAIALDKSRLIHELRESLRQQTAASDILRIISRSTFNLQGVLDTLVELVSELCDADMAAMHRIEADSHRAIAIYGGPSSHREEANNVPLEPGRGSVIGRAMAERKPVQVADVLADPNYGLQEAQRRLGYRSVLGVPLLREGEPIGVIVLMRTAVRPFTDKQVELLQSFASQAIIAIENTRLFNELRARTDDLDRSIGELQRERNNKLMNLEAMVASISHEVRQPLASIASNGGAALRFLKHEPPNLDEARSALNSMVQGSHRASKVFDNIRALFGKADQGHEPIRLNKLALGVLHTLRDDLKDRGVTTRTSLRSELPPITGHDGQLQEVLINLVRNAIEAMDGVDEGQRVLQVRAERHGDSAVALYVEDTGTGIDPKQLDNIFDAFITTKASGMGLGLAICRMIIERHAGQLSVSPALPHGSIFRVLLPAGQTADDERKAREPARH